MKSAKQHVTKVVKKKCSGVRNTIFVSKYGGVEVNRKKNGIISTSSLPKKLCLYTKLE